MESWQECDWGYGPPYTQCYTQEVTASLSPVNVLPIPSSSFTINYNCGVNYQITRNGTPTGGHIWYWQDTNNGFSTANSGSTYLVTTPGVRYLRAKNGNCWSDAIAVTVLADAATIGGTVTSNVEAFVSAGGTLSLSGNNGNVIRWEQSINNGPWQTISNTTSSLTYSGITINTQYRAVSKNGVCSEANSASASITIYPNPVLTLTGPSVLSYGGVTALAVTPSTYYSYTWYKDGILAPTISGPMPSIKEPGKYKVAVKGSATSPLSNPTAEITISALSFQNSNYRSVTRIRKPGVTAATNLYSLNVLELTQAIEYHDGLGRTTQTVIAGQSPKFGDIVQPVSYNKYGLMDTTFLPYTTPGLEGTQRTAALKGAGNNYTLGEQYKFYQGTYNGANATKLPTTADGNTAPFARTLYDNSPLFRVTEQGAPGTDWQPGSLHTVRPVFRVNTVADAVKIWTINGPATAAPLTYAAGLLAVSETKDENDNTVLVFSDKLGRTLLKKVQLGENQELISTPYLETYYVYDDRGNLALQVPPKAVAALGAGAWNTALRDKWCFIYTYDEYNRLIEKKTPDAALVYYGYDKFDRLVLMQDGFLRADSNKWMFMKYDVKGRPVMTGIYKNATHVSRALIQTTILNPLYASGVWYEERGSALHGYTNQSFPTSHYGGAVLRVLSVNYYDNYDFDNNGTDDFSYTTQGIAGEGAQVSAFGLPTGSKRLILGTANWLFSYAFYDKFGRVIQHRSNNHLSLPIDNLTTNIYDFEGQVLQTKMYHNAGGINQVTVVNKFTYDLAGRLIKVFQNNNSAPTDQLVAQYEYNELGQVVDKKLHNTTGTNFLQSVDYRYNMRGWLKSINNAQLEVNAANNDEANDYFGMELSYNLVETGLSNTQYYNGNVSAIKWKSPGTTGTADQRSYKYTYDKSDRLKTAAFQAHTGVGWTKEANTLNEEITYDANGNIKTLLRNQNARGNTGITITSVPQAVDNLTYVYSTTAGNQITTINDTGLATGFVNGTVNAPTDYNYNANGSLIKDDNKGIQTITYNDLGKPTLITYTGSPTKTVAYTYDASGTKLKMVTTVGAVVTTTNYVGGFVYEGATPVLSFFGSPEGRVVKNGSTLEYQYAIADHQGNTRVLFTSVTPAPVAVTATMEAATNANFNNYTNRVGFNLFDHTDAGTTYTYAQKLTGGLNSQVGLAKSYKVYAGDKVKIEAWAKYQNPGSTGSNLAGFASALYAAFGVPVPPGGETGTISSALKIWGGLVTGGSGGINPTGPKAFVNIIVFDKNYKLLDAAWEAVDPTANQIGATPIVPHDYLMREYTAKEEGYVFMYVSNENPTLVDVYFDDIVMTHTKGNVIQYNEYYPFGLQTANSWTRENTTGNQFLNNGATELNATSNVYDLFYRNYDPVLGRMNQVDPLAPTYASYSPYNYSINNPVSFNDPLGLNPVTRIGDDFIIDWDKVGEYGGTWSNDGDGGTWSMYGSNIEAFYAGAENMDRFDSWGQNGNPESFGSAAQAFKVETRILPLQGVGVKYNYNDGFRGEPYSNTAWLQNRIDVSVGAFPQNGFNEGDLNSFYSNWFFGTSAAAISIFGLSIEMGTHPSQRPRYWGPNDFANASKTGKAIGQKLSILGAVVSVGQLSNNPTGGNAVNAIFGVVGAIPGPGTIIGGVYFGVDFITLVVSDKSVSEHIDSYIWMPAAGGMGFIPIVKIPGK
jgi:RHS repeat-associated protein